MIVKAGIDPREQLMRNMRHHIRDRMDAILPHVQKGDILDVGCVDARTGRQATRDRVKHKVGMLFRRIAEANPRTVGVDIDAEGIEMLKDYGYDAICADAVTMDLERKFDTIVAGEIIDHLENPGQFLRNMHRHLKPDGTLLISTPNAFCDLRTYKIWRYGRPSVHEDHTCWFDPITLDQLMRRTGFEVHEGYWLLDATKSLRSWRWRLRSYFSFAFLFVAKPIPNP